MTEFKVGDKVRVKDDADTSSCGRQLRGKVLTISEINEGSEKLGSYFMSEEPENNSGIWLNEVEKVVETFKEGDRVEVTGHHWAWGGEVEDGQDVIGSTGTVGEPRTDEYLNVKIDGRNTVFGLLPSDLKLLSANEPTVDTVPHGTVEKQTHIKVKEGNIAVAHVTNSKRNRVSILKTGTAVGHIKFDDIDTLISLLTRLKEEV